MTTGCLVVPVAVREVAAVGRRLLSAAGRARIPLRPVAGRLVEVHRTAPGRVSAAAGLVGRRTGGGLRGGGGGPARRRRVSAAEGLRGGGGHARRRPGRRPVGALCGRFRKCCGGYLAALLTRPVAALTSRRACTPRRRYPATPASGLPGALAGRCRRLITEQARSGGPDQHHRPGPQRPPRLGDLGEPGRRDRSIGRIEPAGESERPRLGDRQDIGEARPPDHDQRAVERTDALDLLEFGGRGIGPERQQVRGGQPAGDRRVSDSVQPSRACRPGYRQTPPRAAAPPVSGRRLRAGRLARRRRHAPRSGAA